MIPPPELLRSNWLPLIRDFYLRVLAGAGGFPALLVSSWFRTPEKNQTEGGSPESQHLFGLALDITGPPQNQQHLVDHMRAQGLVALRETSHVHVQFLPRGVLAAAGVVFPRVPARRTRAAFWGGDPLSGFLPGNGGNGPE